MSSLALTTMSMIVNPVENCSMQAFLDHCLSSAVGLLLISHLSVSKIWKDALNNISMFTVRNIPGLTSTAIWCASLCLLLYVIIVN